MKLKNGIAGMFLLALATPGWAAFSCSIDDGGVKPFSLMGPDNPIVVSQNTPDGTVIKHWDYGEFLPSMKFSCTTGGQMMTFPAGFNGYIWLDLTAVNNSIYANGIAATNNPGLFLRLYVKAVSVNDSPVANSYPPSEMVPGKTLNTEYLLTDKTASVLFQFGGQYNVDKSQYSFDGAKNFAVQAMAADLVKHGTITYDGTPAVIGFPLRYNIENSNDQSAYVTVLLGTGVYLAQPSCELINKHQIVDLPDLMKKSGGGLPYEGARKAFDLTIECSNTMDNMDITFSDANSAQSDEYLSMFDASSSKPISGIGVGLFDENGNKVTLGEAVKTGAAIQGVGNKRFYAAMTQTESDIKSEGQDYGGDVTARANVVLTYY